MADGKPLLEVCDGGVASSPNDNRSTLPKESPLRVIFFSETNYDSPFADKNPLLDALYDLEDWLGDNDNQALAQDFFLNHPNTVALAEQARYLTGHIDYNLSTLIADKLKKFPAATSNDEMIPFGALIWKAASDYYLMANSTRPQHFVHTSSKLSERMSAPYKSIYALYETLPHGNPMRRVLFNSDIAGKGSDAEGFANWLKSPPRKAEMEAVLANHSEDVLNLLLGLMANPESSKAAVTTYHALAPLKVKDGTFEAFCQEEASPDRNPDAYRLVNSVALGATQSRFPAPLS